MKRRNDIGVVVPDLVSMGDPEWSVVEAARENAFNGSFSTWCLSCARGLKGSAPKRMLCKFLGILRPMSKFSQVCFLLATGLLAASACMLIATVLMAKR